MKFTTVLGSVAASLTTFAMLPQALRVIKTKHTKDLAIGMWVMATSGFILWIFYGILRNDIVLIVANIVSLSLAGTILALKIKHG